MTQPMEGTNRARTVDPRRSGMRLAIFAMLGITAVAAVVFTTSYATDELAVDGMNAQRAEAVVGANSVALKTLGQAVLLAEDHQLGVADAELVAEAVAEARRSLAAFEVAADELGSATRGAQEITPLADAVLESGGRILDLIDRGDVQAAGEELRLAGEGFEALRDGAVAARDSRVELLETAGGLAAHVGNITRFLVAFFLPLVAIVAYRYAARRQLRVAEIQLDARLEAEHEVVKAKDEFIANMSHELRTPLTSIYGFSELLLEEGFIDPDMARELVGMINSESAELGRMVEDLLVSARSEAGALTYTFRGVSPAVELDAVLAPLRREQPDLVVDLPGVEIWADPGRLRQIFRNLLSNAVRHGGDHIRVTGYVAGSHLVVVVEDDGSGVPQTMEPRLFSRFVHDGQAALTEGSVGLGLAVVKDLCEAMGGRVRYERRDGWTRFLVSLPLAGARADDGATAAMSAAG